MNQYPAIRINSWPADWISLIFSSGCWFSFLFSLSCVVIQIREQEVQQPVQGYDWRGFPHQGGAVRGQALHFASKIGSPRGRA